MSSLACLPVRSLEQAQSATPAPFGRVSDPDRPSDRGSPWADRPCRGAPARQPLSILMLGGTGFLGPQTVEAALKRGHKVTLFNRGKTRPGLFPELEKLHGDRDLDDLKALEGRKWDAVVDTSANVPRWVKKAAAVLGPNIGHYVYISSVSVYVDQSKPGSDETSAVATIADPTTEKITGETYGAVESPD